MMGERTSEGLVFGRADERSPIYKKKGLLMFMASPLDNGYLITIIKENNEQAKYCATTINDLVDMLKTWHVSIEVKRRKPRSKKNGGESEKVV
jgi:hypothetical protein